MSDLDALLAGIVANPHETVRWLIVADWLDDNGQCERAELLRLHREMIRTCCEPDQHPERAAWQARIVALIDAGVKPCVPQHTLTLPGGVQMVGNFNPPGSFLMGGVRDSDEKPIHLVILTNGLFVGARPVTQAQWVSVMGENPSRPRQGDELRVDSVSWDDAVSFCTKVTQLVGTTVRLPTEAEWEYACRAGTTTQYHWGDVPDTTRMSCNVERLADDLGERLVYDAVETGSVEDDSFYQATMGPFASNPWGLFDCHGDVSECCADWYGSYPDGVVIDPVGPESGPDRVVRGGSWSGFARDCRSTDRGGKSPEFRFDNGGFRVAFTLS